MNLWLRVQNGTTQQKILDFMWERGGSSTTQEIASFLGTTTNNARSPLDALLKKRLVELQGSKRGVKGFALWRLVGEPLTFDHHPFAQAILDLRERVRILEEKVYE